MTIQGDIPARLAERAAARVEWLVDEAMRLCGIPAPAGEEERRAEYVAQRLEELGFPDAVRRDAAGNVWVRQTGRGGGVNVLLAAHLDTVFTPDQHRPVTRNGDILRAPSIGDNSIGVAAVLAAAAVLKDTPPLLGDVIYAFTVGEEGLGNLKGMKALLPQLMPDVGAALVVEGMGLGRLTIGAVGSRRYRVTFHTPGGHSWNAFGNASAIHSMARAIARIADITVPTQPKTTYTVGMVQGGQSVNSIAATAEMLVDMRSVDAACLAALEEKVRQAVLLAEREKDVTVDITVIGDRPAGMVVRDHPVIKTIAAVQARLGLVTRYGASSTDGNVPISLGIPTVTLGITTGENEHRVDEFIHVTPIRQGLTQLVQAVVAIASLTPPGKGV